MATEHEYRIRRMILTALSEAYPAPMEVGELVEGLPLLADADERERVKRELLTLAQLGYVAQVGQAARPWFQITATGTVQIRQEGKLDQAVWGKLAVM